MDELENLKNKLDQIKSKRAAKESSSGKKSDSQDNMNNGLRAGMELVVSIIAGTLIGLWLDAEFGTKPIFMLALLFLGIITGFVNVWRTTQGIGHAVGYAKQDTKEEKQDKK